jgi:hypothetical protein
MPLLSFEQAVVYANRRVDASYAWYLTLAMADCIRPDEFASAWNDLDTRILFRERIEYLNARLATKHLD